MIMEGKPIKNVPIMYLGRSENSWSLFFLDNMEIIYQMFSRANEKWSCCYLKEYPKNFKKTDNVRISKKFVAWVLEQDGLRYAPPEGFNEQILPPENVNQNRREEDDEEDTGRVGPINWEVLARTMDEAIPIRSGRRNSRLDYDPTVKIAVLPTQLMYPVVTLTDGFFWRIDKTGFGLSTRYHITKKGKKVNLHESILSSLTQYKSKIPLLVDFLVESNTVEINENSFKPIKNRFEIMDFS
jgi:hypothetical protein